jgi:serine/threonine-protein kinase
MAETINGYQILRKISESNTAEIFHVRRLVGKGKGREYALKALRPQCAGHAKEREYLLNEYRICSELDHPNLVRAYEVQIQTARPFLAMDLILGRSLRERLDRALPSLPDALEWHAQVALGLAYFHDAGYVHRDVKPQNIVVGDDGVAKVIDFALARKQDSLFGAHLLRRILNRRRAGTGSYMSPEQILHHRMTGQADIYSLGVSLFESVTGRLPFPGGSKAQDLLHQHVYDPVPSAMVMRPGVPPEVSEFIQAMMAKAPLDRPSGMGYVSVKLRELAAVSRRAAVGRASAG